jgi:hypothetical protein
VDGDCGRGEGAGCGGGAVGLPFDDAWEAFAGVLCRSRELSLWIENMAGIDGDSAWIKDGAGSYRHYCGVTIARDGRLWTAKTVAGVAIPGHISALEAVVSLEKSDPQFWIFGQYGLRFGVTDCGSVHHKTRPVVCGDDEVFVFCLSKDEQVPKFLKTIIDKHFVGIATCVACLAPMCNLQEQRAAQFDWSSSERDTYLACSCGYAVWRMDRKFYDKAGGIISKRASNWRRTLNLRNAGGKHTREEMQIVIALQDGRCIYCDAIFTDQNRPSKDHLLPVSMGGSDWALNIVLACWGAILAAVILRSAPSVGS